MEAPQSVRDETTEPIQNVEAEAKAFIYDKESGTSPCKYNDGSPTGAIDCSYTGTRACGLGQALPCQKLTAVCQLSDYGCQDKWFTGYMLDRFGTWAAAKAYWLCKGTCTNKLGTIEKKSEWW